jgi:hypothetical protein
LSAVIAASLRARTGTSRVARVAAHGDYSATVAVGDVELVRRRERRAELRRLAVAERERGVTAIANVGRAWRAAAEVVNAQRVAFARRDALKSNYDSSLTARLEREDARVEQAMPHPFHERRVTPRADDRFVDVARLAAFIVSPATSLAVDRAARF